MTRRATTPNAQLAAHIDRAGWSYEACAAAIRAVAVEAVRNVRRRIATLGHRRRRVANTAGPAGRAVAYRVDPHDLTEIAITREVVQSPDLPKPLGPYSPVVRGAGLLFVSAQAGVDQATGTVPEGGVAPECRQALRNLEATLRAAGSDLSKVMRLTLFYTDLSHLKEINAVFAEVFPTDPPARSAAIVGLAGGRLISIDAIALA